MKRTCLQTIANNDENITCEFHTAIKNKLFTDEIANHFASDPTDTS